MCARVGIWGIAGGMLRYAAFVRSREAETADRPQPGRTLLRPIPRGRLPGPAAGDRPGADIAASAANGPAEPTSDSVREAAEELRAIARQITSDEFVWQDAHYSRDSRYGREVLYLMAYNGWIRATTENVSVSRSDAVDTSITTELDLDRITHEAFPNQEGDIWLPLLVLPVPGRGPASAARERPPEQAPRRARPKSAQDARSTRFQERRTRLSPAPRRPRPLSEADELAELAEPDPFSSLTVTDASGDLLSIVPSADVRHWISAAMAEIIVNMAVARWVGPAGERPTATRDQRLILSAAIYRQLRPAADFLQPRQASRATLIRPASGRIAHAKDELNTLLSAYIDDYEDHRDGRLPAEEAEASFGHVLTQRAVQILEALAESAIVVVPVNRQRTPTVLTINLPTRRLRHFPAPWLAPPHAELLIDLLMPSADAGRQVRVSLPDGVSLDFSSGDRPVDMVIEVEPPQPLLDLRELMRRLAGGGTAALAAATRQCLADLAIVKAGAAIETLQQHVLRPTAYSGTDPDTVTECATSRLRSLRANLVQLSDGPDDDHGTRESLATVAECWSSGSWFPGRLWRRTSAETLGPRLAVGQAAVVEELAQRGTARRGWINVRVEITDAEFFSIARFAGILSVILMSVVLTFLAIAAHWHPSLGQGSPSPEVLASVLTLFSAIQAGRIERLDRSTLRGMISSRANWLIVASVLPTFILAVALAFDTSGWTPVRVAGAAIFVQLLLQLFMSGRPFRARRIARRWQQRQWLWTSPPPDYARWGVLQSHWWLTTTADALKLGIQAEGYVVWEHGAEPPSLTGLLMEARRAGPPTPVTTPARTDGQLSPVMMHDGDWPAPDATRRAGLAPSGQSRRRPGGNGETDALAGADGAGRDSRPANILAALRSGTAAQALTFIVFREELTKKWPEGLEARPVVLDPDRLAPTENPADVIEVFVSIPASGNWPAITHHPILAVLKAARDQQLLVLEVTMPMPTPVAEYHDRIWARVRVGLRDAEIRRLPAFLGAVEGRIRNLAAVSCDAWVRTVPGARLRVLVAARPAKTAASPGRATARPGPTVAARPGMVSRRSKPAPPAGVVPSPEASAGRGRPVLASDIDVVACVTRARAADPKIRDWRVLALCADARAGGEADILGWMGQCWPGMRLAGLTYAVLHGTAVMLMLVHQPDGRIGIKGDSDLLTRKFRQVHVAVLYDEWQSPQQLGLVADEPLLGVHIDAPDQPGSLLDTLDSLYKTLNSFLPGERDLGNCVWHAVLRVAAWSTSRLMIRLAATDEEVKDWDRTTFEEIERLTRQRAIQAAAVRRAAGLTGDRQGAPEDTVVSVSLVRFPEKPGRTANADPAGAGRPADGPGSHI